MWKLKSKKETQLPFHNLYPSTEANRKFSFSARDTMSVAQKLYEKGFITYMRTDSTRLSGQAIEAARGGFVDRMEKNIYLSEFVITRKR